MTKHSNRRLVALQAGVSEATVSRVFNNPDAVSPQKVQLVTRAANELGYVPNKYASALRRKGSGVILFLENRDDSRHYQWIQISHYNAFYAEIIRAISQEADRSLYHLRLQTISSIKETAELKKGVDCDGIIGFNFEDERSVEVFKKTDIPYVCCHHTEIFDDLNHVSTDNFQGGFLQANALKNKGYQSPLYVTGALDETISHKERMKGFLSGFPDCSVQVLQTDPSLEGGNRIGDELIKKINHCSVDCIGVVNDLTAIGILQKLLSAGIRVPDDVALIGYDNIPALSVLPVRLTTIDLLLPSIYQQAFRSLLKLIRQPKPISKKIQPLLIEGNSI